MKTVAAYIRVSDERQDEFSPDSQIKLIKEYCTRNDMELPDEFVFYDDGISAKSVKKRVQFNEMIALAKQKEKPFSAILVWKFSRFARNQEESIVYKAMLRKNGVDVISISEPIQDNPFGGLIERIIEWMDEYYLIRLSDEVRRGMTERAARGLPNAAPPFGYNMKDGRYVINEEEAEIVRLIFDMFIKGQGMRNISSHLRQLGVKNHYGNYIDNRGVEYILYNPCYAGYVRWNPHGRSASARNFGNTEDILKKSHDPIVSEETFNRVQDILAQRKKAHQKFAREDFQTSKYALKGLVKCDNCGSTLVYSPASKGLQCHKYSSGACEVSHHINIGILNKMVVDELKRAVRELSFNLSAVTTADSSIAPEINYDALINAEKLKLERARQAYQEGVDSLNEYKAQKQKIEKRIEKIKSEKQKNAILKTGIDVKAFAKTVSDVIEVLESDETSEELKNKALRSIVQKIVFFKPDKHIEIFFYI